MKTETSEIRYYDISPEDLDRYLREAEVLRSQAVTDMAVGAKRKIKFGLNALRRSVSRFFHDLRTHAPMSSGS